jgi:hypothetical protein
MNRVFKGLFKWIMILALALSLATVAVAEEKELHWYATQGKGRPLCEELVKIANANPAIDNWTPNIPWKEVLAIKGVREPEWKELDPLKYESLFLDARKYLAQQNSIDEQSIPFPKWFLPLKQRWVDRNSPKKRLSDEDALKMYRNFANRGGKLKVYWPYIPAGLSPRAFVQYESPDKGFSYWDGFTIEAATGLTGVHPSGFSTNFFGRGYRIFIYEGRVYSFFGFRKGYEEYRVALLVGDMEMDEQSPYALDTFYCRIISEIIGGKKK